MDITEKIGKTISTPPWKVNVSIHGVWEKAWNIPFENGMPSLNAIEKYLAKGTERIAFQMFFRTDDGYNITIGIRFHEQLQTKTPKEFLYAAFDSIWSTRPPKFAPLIRGVSEALTGDPQNLFGIDPTGVELGVIGWWKSLGFLEIWNDSKKKNLQRIALKKQLEAYPHLLQNDKSYTALELAYHSIPQYWLGIQIADKNGEEFVLNEKRLEDMLHDLVGILLT